MDLRASTVKLFGMIAAIAIASSSSAAADPAAQAVADETKKAAQELAAKFAGDAPAGPQQTPMTTGSINETEAPPMLSALSQSARAAGEHAFDYETFARQEEDEAEPTIARPAKASKREISKRRQRDRKSDDAQRQARAAPPPPQAAAAAKKDEEPSLLAKFFTPSEWSWPGGGDENAASTAAAPPTPTPTPAFTDNEPTAADTTRSALQP